MCCNHYLSFVNKSSDVASINNIQNMSAHPYITDTLLY